jgi:anthranilate/para-aminobenzoate synthase component I
MTFMAGAAIHKASIEGISFENAAKALSDLEGFFCIDARHSRLQRYSVIGALPSSTFSIAGAFVTCDGHTIIDTPIDALKRFVESNSDAASDPYIPVSTGIYGYIGFEAASAMRGFKPAEGFSRLPQCRLCRYDAVIIHDRVEDQLCIVSTDGGASRARRFLDAIGNFQTSPQAPLATMQPDSVRFHPDDAQFKEICSRALEWLRSDEVDRIHIARHAEFPEPHVPYLGRFFSEPQSDSVRSFFSIGGASAAIASEDATVVSFEKFSPADELLCHLPTARFVGDPIEKAFSFIESADLTHRRFYGGCAGYIGNKCLILMNANRVEYSADGTVTRTAGVDITPDKTAFQAFEEINGYLPADETANFTPRCTPGQRSPRHSDS